MAEGDPRCQGVIVTQLDPNGTPCDGPTSNTVFMKKLNADVGCCVLPKN